MYATLPDWLRWITWPAAAFVLAAIVARIGCAVAFGRAPPPGVHWTEQARATFPGSRWANGGPLIVVLLLLVFWQGWLFDGSLAGRVRGALTGLAAYAGALIVAVAVSSRRRLPVTPREALRGLAISLFFFIPALIPCLVALVVASGDRGQAFPWPAFGAAALATLAMAAGGSYRLAHAVGLIAPPDARMMLALQEAARRGGRMPRSSGILRWRHASALALPSSDAVLFTSALLEQSEDEELVLITLHELAHLSESRAVGAARVASSLILVPFFWLAHLVVHFGAWGVAVPLLVVIVGSRLYRALAVRMEVKADAEARAHQLDEGAYARVLEKLYRINLMPAVMSPREGVHPNLYDRMVAAGVTPFYPRPRPPARGRVFWANVVAAALLALAAPWAGHRLHGPGRAAPVEEAVPAEPEAEVADAPAPAPSPAAPADPEKALQDEFDRVMKQIP